MATAELIADRDLTHANGDESLYEVINGVRVESKPMGVYSSIIASRLHGAIQPHAKQHDLGEAVMEILFRLPLPEERNRRPDVAFVSYARWPKGRPQVWKGNAWDVVPDLAVEIVSPNDLAEEIIEKLNEYFRAGVRLAWVVYPRQRTVHVYTAFDAIRVVTMQHTLDGGDVLPEFQLPLASLFTEELI